MERDINNNISEKNEVAFFLVISNLTFLICGVALT